MTEKTEAEVPGNGFSCKWIGMLETDVGRMDGRPDRYYLYHCETCRVVQTMGGKCQVCSKPSSRETGQAKAGTEKHTLDQALEDANVWARATFPTETTAGVVNHLRREVEELAKHPTDWAEMADVLILLARLADRAGVDLREAVESKLSLLRTREWGEPDADGVVEHIRADNSR